MDYLNDLLPFLAIQTQTQVPKTNGTSAKTDQTEFRAMLDRRRGELTKSQDQTTQEGVPVKEQPTGTVESDAETQDGASGEEQLAMAALAAAQMAVVVPAPEQTAAEQETVQVVQILSSEGVQPEVENQPKARQMETAPEGEEAPVSRPEAQTDSPIRSVERQEAGTGERNTDSAPDPETRRTGDQRVKVEDTQAPTQEESRPIFRDVEAAPVKVGSAAQPQKTAESEGVERQLFQPLEKAVEQNESSVRVSLTPESLGSVTVELTRKEDGGLHILLHADNPRTQSILEKSAAGLQSLLMDGARGAVQVQVERQENSQGGQQHPYDQEGQSGGQQGQSGRQDQQSQQQRREADFLQQLRLGLIPLDGEAS